MRRLFPVIFVMSASLVGCATPPKAYIPVDSPMRTWSAPEEDAYAPDAPPAAPSSPAPADDKAASPPKKAGK